MAAPTVGKKIAAFNVATTSSPKLTSKDLAGRPYVLYFYPKDDTPGCTLEGQDFRDRHADFAKLNVRILGVSRDTLASHAKFQGKYGLPFELVSDEPDDVQHIGRARGPERDAAGKPVVMDEADFHNVTKTTTSMTTQ